MSTHDCIVDKRQISVCNLVEFDKSSGIHYNPVFDSLEEEKRPMSLKCKAFGRF